MAADLEIFNNKHNKPGGEKSNFYGCTPACTVDFYFRNTIYCCLNPKPVNTYPRLRVLR